MNKHIAKLASAVMLLQISWLGSGLLINAQQESAGSYVFWADNLEEAQEAADEYGAELISYSNGIGTLLIPESNPDVTSEPVMMCVLAEDGGVSGNTISGNTVSENVIMENTVSENTVPKTELFPNYLYTVQSDAGNTRIAEQWHIDYLDMRSVWKLSTGKGIKVAIVDSGIDTDHEALSERIALAETVIPESAYGPNGYFLTYQGPEDRLGHGTHVAGIIGAGTKDKSVMGIAPECNIYSFKALEKSGNSASGYTSWIADGILRAIENDADVINLSIGGGSREDRFIARAVDLAMESGCIVVGAAGNYYGTGVQNKIDYPAADPDVIAVTAAKKTNEAAEIDLSYSKYGEGVDFIAPGTQIFSSNLDGAYGKKSGTSMATPMVSGTIALLLEEKPQAAPQEIIKILAETALDLGDEGVDIYHGYGMIQPLKAVKSVQPAPAPENSKPEESLEPTETETPVEENTVESQPQTALEQQIEELRQELETLPPEDQQLYEIQTDNPVEIQEIPETESCEVQENESMPEEEPIEETVEPPSEEKTPEITENENIQGEEIPDKEAQEEEKSRRWLLWIIPIIIILLIILEKERRRSRV